MCAPASSGADPALIQPRYPIPAGSTGWSYLRVHYNM